MSTSEQQHALRRDLESRGIADARVLDAIEHVRRDLFVPEPIRDAAYDDSALPIGDGQTISQPYIVALMTQELHLTGDQRVLEIGTGSGYQTAILAALSREVITIERLEALSRSAQRVLADAGVTNVEFFVGDGTLGVPERGPYDRILVTACAPTVPQPLYEQLKPNGWMIVPVGDLVSQDLIRVEKTDSGQQVTPLCGCRFVKLIGKEGWAE
jgi:protein-L-isoaspartate(D-aspartate) O-methyltransferase